MTLDGIMFYITNTATIIQLFEEIPNAVGLKGTEV
jgi:hypothetical protein